MTTLRFAVSFSRLEGGGTPFYGAKLLKLASGQLPAMVHFSKYSLSQKRTLIEAGLRLLMLHHNLGSNRHAAIKVGNVIIDHPEASRRHRLTDRLRRVGAVDAVDGRADVERARAERIAGTAGHPARKIRLPRDHLRRWRPVRPLSLFADVVHAAPLKAIAADSDAVPHGDAVAHDEIEEAIVRVDDDRARRLFGAVVHRLPAQFRRQLARARGLVDSGLDIFHRWRGRRHQRRRRC